MKRFKVSLLLLMIIACFTSFKEEEFLFRIEVSYLGESVETGRTYYSEKYNDSIRIDNCKFYVSGIKLYQDDLLYFEDQPGYHLMDVSELSSMLVRLNPGVYKGFNRIEFNLGLDSQANVSGILEGALDPVHGMYWSWQSGYVHFKLEGKSRNSGGRKQEFNFHLGGYSSPNSTVQKLSFPADNRIPIVHIPLDSFFAENDLKTINSVMVPGGRAVELSALIAKSAYVR